MSFVDRHDEIPSRVLQRLMNRAVAQKNSLVAKEQQNLLRVSVNGISAKVALEDIHEKAWTEEVERECGETLIKVIQNFLLYIMYISQLFTKDDVTDGI